MATLSTLLTVGAVPFTLGPLNNGGVSSRRRRHPAGNLTLPAAPQHPVPDLHQILNNPEDAGFVAVVLNEAGRSLEVTSGSNGSAGDTPEAPPNTPAASSATADTQTFTFPEVGDKDESDDKTTPMKPVVSTRQTLRKRRRIPSFNSKHRETPKLTCQASSDADDEESDSDVIVNQNDSDAEAKQELSFKLRILAESQTAKNTDWAKVGEELRQIADSFHSLTADDSTENGARHKDLVPTDVLSLINMFLPISIPQSLWSAIVSYAAWKILKRLH